METTIETQTEKTFQGFPKIARLNREVVVSEKIDGTNAAVVVADDGTVYAQSRTRIITPSDDNFGFARWVSENADALRDQLGYGRHFGEWWGAGIQRRYGLNEKRFSLFNLHKWHGGPTDGWRCIEAPVCYVVPTLRVMETFDTVAIASLLKSLAAGGSLAAPAFMNPEGVVVYHRHSGALYKATIENDDRGKEHE